MRTFKRKYVLLFATLLSFANGSPLFAGMISLPPMVDVTSPGISQTDFLLHSADLMHEDNSSAALNSSGVQWIQPPESNSTLERLGSLHCAPYEQAAHEEQPSDLFDPLPANDGSNPPAPRPTAPGGGGATGGSAVAPNTERKDQQNALATWSNSPIPEHQGNADSFFVLFISKLYFAGIFRPPRAFAF